MKQIFMPVIVALSIFSTPVFAKDMSPVTSPDAKILHYLTDVNSVSLGNFTARVITISSFAEPVQSLYLQISKDVGFDPAETNTVLYDLSKEIGPGYSFRSVSKVGDNEILVVAQKQNRNKVVFVTIKNDLAASAKQQYVDKIR